MNYLKRYRIMKLKLTTEHSLDTFSTFFVRIILWEMQNIFKLS